MAFYALALEQGLTRLMAGLSTMALFSGPAFRVFSFSFHTDVPFGIADCGTSILYPCDSAPELYLDDGGLLGRIRCHSDATNPVLL